MDYIYSLLPILKQSVVITGFVFVMMLIIEYVNVKTHGEWQNKLSQSRFKQYLFSALLGAIPGCLGAYTVVAMYSHGLLSLGAIVTAMIATSGDEAFLMFATIPKTAFIITGILFIVGIVAGFFTDKIFTNKKYMFSLSNNELPMHSEDEHEKHSSNQVITNLKRPSPYRVLLIAIIIVILTMIFTNVIAADEEAWIRTSLIIVNIVALFIVITVPNHFLVDHLWGHVTKIHVPRIFLWVSGTLIVFNILLNYFNLGSLITENIYWVMVAAVLIGIIPESGPHFIFITLFAQGAIPFSVLLASSISQDGHGMLPMLAESRRSFLLIKAINVAVALIVGTIALIFGF